MIIPTRKGKRIQSCSKPPSSYCFGSFHLDISQLKVIDPMIFGEFVTSMEPVHWQNHQHSTKLSSGVGVDIYIYIYRWIVKSVPEYDLYLGYILQSHKLEINPWIHHSITYSRLHRFHKKKSFGTHPTNIQRSLPHPSPSPTTKKKSRRVNLWKVPWWQSPAACCHRSAWSSLLADSPPALYPGRGGVRAGS